MKKLEILMIGPAPSGESSGGIVAVIDSIIKNLDKKYTVTYIVTMRPVGIIKRILIYIKSFYRIIKSIMNNNQKIAHVHLASRISFYRKSLIIMILKFFKIPLIIHLHGGEFHIFFSKELNQYMKRYVRWIFSLSDETVLLTNSWQKWYVKTIGLSNSKVIYNGVRDYYSSDSKYLKERENSILFLGKLGKNKGIYDLLYAFKKVLELEPTAKLNIGGDGEINNCKKLSEELQITENVKFFGWIGEKEKAKLLNESKIYILPSYNEGLPMGILEAMSTGLVVISTAVGGIPEVITDKKNGLLIKPGDQKAISESIVSVLTNKYNIDVIGKNARDRYLQDFNIQNITRKIEKEYDELLK